MAKFYHIPKGGKSIKFADKPKPWTQGRKYKALSIILSLIILLETVYFYGRK